MLTTNIGICCCCCSQKNQTGECNGVNCYPIYQPSFALPTSCFERHIVCYNCDPPRIRRITVTAGDHKRHKFDRPVFTNHFVHAQEKEKVPLHLQAQVFVNTSHSVSHISLALCPPLYPAHFKAPK